MKLSVFQSLGSPPSRTAITLNSESYGRHRIQNYANLVQQLNNCRILKRPCNIMRLAADAATASDDPNLGGAKKEHVSRVWVWSVILAADTLR